MFSFNLVLRVSFAFLTSKGAELLWWSLFLFWMTHETRNFSDGCLFVPRSLWIFFDRKTRYFWLNFTFTIVFLLYNKEERMGERIFPEITLIAKKASTKSDQHHIPVQRSRTISNLSVIILLHLKTSDEFHSVKSGCIWNFSGPYCPAY